MTTRTLQKIEQEADALNIGTMATLTSEKPDRWQVAVRQADGTHSPYTTSADLAREAIEAAHLDALCARNPYM